MASLSFAVDGRVVDTEPEAAILAGYSGRDAAEVQRHITELAQRGIPAPSEFPAFYIVLPDLLRQSDYVDVLSSETSGEAEFALIVSRGRTFVTVASDHTDRHVEATDVELSKRLYPKILSTEAWELDHVGVHWDRLQLSSWVELEQGLEPYQLSALSNLVPVDVLLRSIPWRRVPSSYVVLGGTVPTLDGLRIGKRFRAELHDPVLNRTLAVDYRVDAYDVLRR